jgi:hypothetical protein
MQDSKAWQAARKLPKQTHAQRHARGKAFKQVREFMDFKDSRFQREAILLKYDDQGEARWIEALLGANTLQKLGTRAYRAVEKTITGPAKRVRFKPKNRFRCLESKNNASGLRVRQDEDGAWGVYVGKTWVPALIDAKDPVTTHALTQRIKYSRLLWRRVRGKKRYYLQLVLEGHPYHKPQHTHGKGKVSLDLGPTKYAVVAITQKVAFIGRFCAELRVNEQKIRLIQRKIARQQRANNPEYYHDDFQDKRGKWKQGTVVKVGKTKTGKKSKRWWTVSTRQQIERDRLAEEHRLLAATRKTLQGRLSNELMSLGNEFYLEKVSLRAWQKLWGKSIQTRAPGMLLSTLRRKAESANGSIIEFPPYQAKLSQRCECDRIYKKKLSERVHVCPCGIIMDRDLYSARLGTAVDQDGVYQADKLEAYQEWEHTLRAAWTRGYQQGISATGNPMVDHPSLNLMIQDNGQSRSFAKEELIEPTTEDAVILGTSISQGESLGEAE